MRTWITAALFLTLAPVFTLGAEAPAKENEFPMEFVSSRAKWLEYLPSQFIETSTMVHTREGNVRAWTKILYPDGVHGILILVEIDCRERMVTNRITSALGAATKEQHQAMEELQKTWTTPKQRWDYMGLADDDFARYTVFCGPSKTTAKGK